VAARQVWVRTGAAGPDELIIFFPHLMFILSVSTFVFSFSFSRLFLPPLAVTEVCGGVVGGVVGGGGGGGGWVELQSACRAGSLPPLPLTLFIPFSCSTEDPIPRTQLKRNSLLGFGWCDWKLCGVGGVGERTALVGPITAKKVGWDCLGLSGTVCCVRTFSLLHLFFFFSSLDFRNRGVATSRL
jgi:hypothetical protein